MQSWMNKRGRAMILVLTWALVLWVTAPAWAQAELGGDEIAGKYTYNVIRLLASFSNGREKTGFGFVVGERDDMLYVVTADRVVRWEDDPDAQTTGVYAQFYPDPGRSHKAVLLDMPNKGLDLALLEIKKPFASYAWEKRYIHPSLERGDRVWYIGWGKRWASPLSRGLVNRPASFWDNRHFVEDLEGMNGKPGAPLFTTKGIAGMIVQDDSAPGEVAALSIEAIRAMVMEKWNYPWQLGQAPPKGDVWTAPVTGMVFVWVQAGCYKMGCGEWEREGDGEGECDGEEKPVHEVCVDGFWMGKYEVTQGEWNKIMESNPSSFKTFRNWNNHPVERVSWNDAMSFIGKLSAKSGISFRLPTEAEWEYACRSRGKPEKYSGGNDLDHVAWHGINSGGSTHAVGTKAANGLGTHDMSGNVWEWVADDWHSSYEGAPKDGTAWVDTPRASYRVYRGGSWNGTARDCRSVDRVPGPPDLRLYRLGFRLARSASPDP